MKRPLTEKDIDPWHDLHNSYEVLPQIFGYQFHLRVRRKIGGDANPVWVCAEIENNNDWIWLSEETFLNEFEYSGMIAPEFDLDDMELAEIIMDEMK